MKKEENPQYIEFQATREPYLDHADYKKCGLCLKNYLYHEVAKEFSLQGKIGPEHIPAYQAEVTKRFQESILFKEIQALKKQGLTLKQAIKKMQKRGYDP